MEILLVKDNEITNKIKIKPDNKVKQIKDTLKQLLGDLNRYNIRMYLNKKEELKVFTSNEWDDVKLKSIWNKLDSPFITVKEANLNSQEIRMSIFSY